MSCVQCLCANEQQLLPEGVLQETQDREEERVWETNSRSWAWDLYSTGLVNTSRRWEPSATVVFKRLAGLINILLPNNANPIARLCSSRFHFHSLIQLQCTYVGCDLHFIYQQLRSNSVTIQSTSSVERPGWGTESPPAWWQSNWPSYFPPFLWVLIIL